VVTAAALVKVACLLNSRVLPVRQHCQQFAGSVWAAWVVGGMSAGVRLRLVVLPPSLGVGAARQYCVVALRCGLAVTSGLHGTGWHLHGVGLAGAWVWGAVASWPVWSGPGWCSGHWCGLALPRNVEVTAASGDAACLGLWGQLRCVLCPGTSGGGCCGMVCCVLCVVCRGTWGRLPWLAVVGWGSVTWQLGGVSASMARVCANNTPCGSPPGGVSPVVCSTPVVSYMPHIPQMRGKGCGDSSVSFGAFGTCQTTRS
jgi:hypothetical protein